MASGPTPPNVRNILLLAPGLAPDEPLAAALRERAEVRTVQTTDEALSALKTGLFDLVVATPTELFPVARAEARQRAELILEQLGQSICIVDRHGTLIWTNARLRTYSAQVIEAIRQQCAEMCGEFAVSSSSNRPTGSRQRTVRVGQDYVFDLTAAPLLAGGQQVEEVVGLALDVTSSHRLQEKLNAIDAAGRELVRLDAEALARLDAGERLELLEEKINRFAHDLLNFDHFVVRVLDTKTNRLDTLIAQGLPEESKSMALYATVEGNGISGHVAATGRSYLCPDVKQDRLYRQGLAEAGSSLTVPLWLQDQVVGVFDVESHDIAAFTEDDRQFAEIFGRYIAIALNILKLLAVERYTTTGQLAQDVASELAVPLDDIVAAATKAMESPGSPDELRRSLQGIVANVERVKHNLQSLTETPGIRGLIPAVSTKDPLLDGRRILVAEDEDIIRETIADVLTKGGALTVMARDGQEAVAMIHAQHFDLVISDIKMPYKNGYEVFAAVKQANPSCPVVLVTGFGYDPEHSIVRASKEGLAAVLFKPFKVEQLLEAAHDALAARA